MKEVSKSVIFTDLVGFSKLRLSLGDSNAFRVLEQIDSMSGKIIDKNEGDVIKTIGDSIMAVFDSPLNCIKSAIEMQQEYYNYNKKIIDNRRKIPPIRIGICYGLMDEMKRFGHIDYLGTIVDRAARVESLAQGGHIFTTESDIKIIEGRIVQFKGLLLDFHTHGFYTLKGLGDFNIIEILYRLPDNPSFIAPQNLFSKNENIQEQILNFIKTRPIIGLQSTRMLFYSREYQNKPFLNNFSGFIDFLSRLEKEIDRNNEAVMTLTEVGIKKFNNPDQIASILCIYAEALMRARQFYQAEDVLAKSLEIHSDTPSKQAIEEKMKRFQFAKQTGSLGPPGSLGLRRF